MCMYIPIYIDFVLKATSFQSKTHGQISGKKMAQYYLGRIF